MLRSKRSLVVRLVHFLILGLALSASPIWADNHFAVSFVDGVRKVGPLSSAIEQELVQSRLDANGIAYRAETTEIKESLGFIVVTPLFESKTQAGPTLRDLADEGIKDYLYVGRGVYVDRISAGVYSARATAENRANRLNEAGFDFEVVERTQTIFAVEVIVLDTLISDSALRRALSGEILTPVVPEPAAPEPAVVDEPVPEPGPEAVSEPAPQAAPPPVVEPQKQTEPAPVIRQPPPTADSSWLWILFIGISIIVIGSLAYYYLQRREQAPATQIPFAGQTAAEQPTRATKPAPAPEARAADATAPAAEQEAPAAKQEAPAAKQEAPAAEQESVAEPTDPRGMIFDYAEAVLAGRAGSSVNQSLTILGSDDTAITDLIQDLIFLARLSDGQVELSPLSFDCGSLVDNIITKYAPLANNKQITLKSTPSDDMPASVSLDASKLDRIMSILIQYAIERTESGQISINQSFEKGLLETEVRFHPGQNDMDAQLATIMDPAKTISSLQTEERVRFGVANKLVTALGGTLTAGMETGEAVIQINVAATEVQKPQLVLPSGKTIDDLLEAEARASEEIAKARQEAEEALKSRAEAELAEINVELERTRHELEQALNARAEAEKAAQQRVTDLEGELDVTRQSVTAEAEGLRAKEERAREEVSELKAQLAKLQSVAASSAQDKTTAESDISTLRTALTEAEAKLAEESMLRTEAEEGSEQRVENLIEQLNEARQSAEQESTDKSQLSERLQSLNGELERTRQALESKTTETETLKSAQQEEVRKLQEELGRANQDLEKEQRSRQETEETSRQKVAELETSLDSARQEKESELAGRDERIQSATLEIDRLTAELETAETFGKHQTERLQQALSDAETAARVEAAAKKVAKHLKKRVTQLETRVIELKTAPAAAATGDEVEPKAETAEPEGKGEYAVTSDSDFSLADFGDDKSIVAEEAQAAEDQAEAEILTPEDKTIAAAGPVVELDEFALDDFDDELVIDQEVISAEEVVTVAEEVTRDEPARETLIEEEPITAAPEPGGTIEPEAKEEETDVDEELVFDDRPLRSSRPVSNPVLHSMIERFRDRLFEHIESMERSLAARDYLELVVSCNWVRGEANTLGFEVLIGPIDSIEQHLRKNKFSQIITHISILRNMAERIHIKHQVANADSTIQYIVPSQAKSAVIYENFISQLGSKLLELEVAARNGNTRQMTQVCRWIDRYGTKIKFVEVVDAARHLQDAINADSDDQIDQQLKEFIDLYGKIEIVKSATA